MWAVQWIGVIIAVSEIPPVIQRTLGKSAKRGGGEAPIPFDEAKGVPDQAVDLVRLDEALEDFAKVDPRSARIVELRQFGGLSIDETAEVLEISPATVKRDWTVAKAWLRRATMRSRNS